MLNIVGEQCPSYAMEKHWITKEKNLPLNMKTDREDQSRAIVKYLYLEELRGQQIHKYMLSNFRSNILRMWPWKIALQALTEFSTEYEDWVIQFIILLDRRFELKQIPEALNISYERLNHIVHVDLVMKKHSAKWILKCLNVDQKHAVVEASASICAQFGRGADFVSRVVSVDITWVCLYDPETKQPAIEWSHSGSPTLKMFYMQKSGRKALPSIFCDFQIDFLDKGRTITTKYYSTLLITLWEEIVEGGHGKLFKVFLFL